MYTHHGVHRFSELTLTNVNRSQSGDYTCAVRIDDEVAAGSGTLTVFCELHSIYVYVCCIFVLLYHLCVCSYVYIYVHTCILYCIRGNFEVDSF